MADRFQISDFAYAHRGLWTDGGLTENSLEACLAAASEGLGIEFDVRPSRDGVPLIFHDAALDRMTHETGKFEDRSVAELLGTPLKGGGHIISLEHLLSVWPGDTPLLCELKIDGQTHPATFARTVGDLLLAHHGPVAAMSFSRRAVAALPDTLMRGQLIAPSSETGHSNLAETPTVSVDYLACHVSDAQNKTLQIARATLPLITWTVRSEAECLSLLKLTDSQIFEGFDPALAKRHILNR